MLFTISFIITSILTLFNLTQEIGALFQALVAILLPHTAKQIEILNLVAVLIITLLLSLILPVIYNKIADVKSDGFALINEWKKVSDSDDSPEFFNLCIKSIELELPIAITLSNKKVYIGYLRTFGVKANDISILPLRSGYRSDTTIDYEQVIDYIPVVESILENANPKARKNVQDTFIVSIPHREIVHASLYNFEYQKHFEDGKKDEKDPDSQASDTSPKVIEHSNSNSNNVES